MFSAYFPELLKPMYYYLCSPLTILLFWPQRMQVLLYMYKAVREKRREKEAVFLTFSSGGQ
jgi:hypothetical protein